MIRRGLAGTTALVALAGCTAGDSDTPVPAMSSAVVATATAAPATTTARPAPATKPAMDDVAACFDGRCELEVRGSVEIPLDPSFRLPGLTVTVVRGGVTAASGGVRTGGSAGSQLTLNDTLRIEILSVRGTTARILLSQPSR